MSNINKRFHCIPMTLKDDLFSAFGSFKDDARLHLSVPPALQYMLYLFLLMQLSCQISNQCFPSG